MARAKDHRYDESKIRTLSSLEHIRLRPGMYVGRTGDGSRYEDGVYMLVKEVVDNAVDEHICGHGARIDVTVAGRSVTVRDYGRGIPLGKVAECVSRINTGAKYNDDVFQFSVGLNGVGTKAVNALSESFTVRSRRGGRFVEASFERGRPAGERSGEEPGAPDGTEVRFVPDEDIFGDVAYRREFLARRLRFYAYLNPGLRLHLNGRAFVSRRGLADLVRDESQGDRLYPPLHARERDLALAFTHVGRDREQYYSFVNGQFTADGGTHLSAFREGLLKGVNEFSGSGFGGDDVREGILAAVALRLRDPVFESQTKNRLGNTELRSALVARVRDLVADLLHKNRSSAEKLLARAEEARRLRAELRSVKKLARRRARATSIRVPQLKDCKVHRTGKARKGPASCIFLTEGQSAAGSLTSCRDVETQAVFTLKGKPLNVWDLERKALYENTEIYNLMRSLRIEESVDRLRYHKVVLATDADVDGLHIRNLLIALFLRFFPRLVEKGHLHILETPLYRVRTKKETRYAYSDAERDRACEALGRSAEVTRFKGLGEISPSEFKGFLGPDMRLRPVTVEGQDGVTELLDFYMGRNTPARRQYIMENLVVDGEA